MGPFHLEELEYYDRVNFLKAGIAESDLVTTVSPSYAEEIKTEAYGRGLHTFLRNHESKTSGILNGLDYKEWNPPLIRTYPAILMRLHTKIKK